MSTTEKYKYGWSDPRMPSFEKTGFEDVSTDVLKNLWFVAFQGPSTESLSVKGDMKKVVQELVKRKVVDTQLNDDFEIARFCYILKEENGNS